MTFAGKLEETGLNFRQRKNENCNDDDDHVMRGTWIRYRKKSTVIIYLIKCTK